MFPVLSNFVADFLINQPGQGKTKIVPDELSVPEYIIDIYSAFVCCSEFSFYLRHLWIMHPLVFKTGVFCKVSSWKRRIYLYTTCNGCPGVDL